MDTVFFNPRVDDEERRNRLFKGQLFAYSALPSVHALVRHADQMIREAFGDVDPLMAQFGMPVEEYVAIGAPLKPRFIHHPKTKELLRDFILEIGGDLETTYIDVPRLRLVTSHGYLTAGVGYAHPPHRDTWFSAPMSQQSWWLPIYEIESESSMAFHPRYWSQPVKNGSSEFNYYEWNAVGRKSAAQHIKTDTRKQPHPEEPLELVPQVRLVPEVGGIILFSGAQLHSTVPNTSGRARYSIDFRTVNLADLKERCAAPNIDSDCTGTSLRDFMRGTDFSRMPEDIVALYDSGPRPDGELIFRPPELAVMTH